LGQGQERETIMKVPAAMLPMLGLGLLTGCQKAPPPVQPSPDYARFQLVSSAYLYALDTKTGQLCKTFNQTPDFHIPKGLTPVPNPDTKPIDRIPLCIDLSQDEAATIKTLRGQ
jgi:hypothetical protein